MMPIPVALVKNLLEYGGLKFMAAVVNRLPYRAALAVGWLNARISHGLSRSRVATAKARIRQVFGSDLSPQDVRRVAWLSWRNIVFNGVELLRIPRMSAAWTRSVSNCDIVADAVRRHAPDGGAILATPHMGSWELAAVACHFAGVRVFSITAKQRNVFVNDYLNRLREAPGSIPTIPRGSGTLREVLRRLQDGQVLAILPDVRMPVEGVQIPFLGGVANLGEGMAAFARHAGVPILPCIVKRVGWSRHLVAVHDPVRPDPSREKKDDIRRMTAAVMAIIESEIRRDPAQWFWFNKRWVLDPIPAPARPQPPNA